MNSRSSISRRWVMSASIALPLLFAAGCSEDDDSQSPDPPAPAPASVNPDAGASEAPATEELEDEEVGMDALMALTRRIDAWHEGRKSIVGVHYDNAANAAVDDFGNELSLTRARWDQLIAMIENSPNRPMTFRTSPSEYFVDQDDLGEVARHVYEVDVTNEGEVLFQWIRKHDG